MFDPARHKRRKHWALFVALLGITGSIYYLEAPFADGSSIPEPPANIPDWALENPGAPDFAGGKGWLNTDAPIDLVEKRGEVVLVDFWTYSCINCIHTFPYLNAWHDHYNTSGLNIVGVHTPEFRFERDIDNVADAIDTYDLEHAVVIDNDYDIWRAYHNRFWPAKYLIDEWGRIRYVHFGEGSYGETEDWIRKLLAEAGHDVPEDRVNVTEEGGYGTSDQTPELFASHLNGRRNHAIGNAEGYHPGQEVYHEPVSAVVRGNIYLTGPWYHDDEHVRALDNNTSVVLSFWAGAVNFVAGGAPGTCVPVFLDGSKINATFAARDVNTSAASPCITLDGHRSYDVLASDKVWGHLLVLDTPKDFELYSFAFSRDGRR